MKSKNKQHSPLSVVITLPDPDDFRVLPIAEVGGTMEWRTESVNYPDFELHFKGENPENDTPDLVRKGSRQQPVVLRVTKTGTFEYTVRHCKKNGGGFIEGESFAGRVVPCPHCAP